METFIRLLSINLLKKINMIHTGQQASGFLWPAKTRAQCLRPTALWMSDDPVPVTAAVSAHGAPASAPRLLQPRQPEGVTAQKQEETIADLHVMELEGGT